MSWRKLEDEEAYSEEDIKARLEEELRIGIMKTDGSAVNIVPTAGKAL